MAYGKESSDEAAGIREGPMTQGALRVEVAAELRRLIETDVLRRAWVRRNEADLVDPQKPFIVYPPMNREPELGLAVAVVKLALLELKVDPMDEVGFLFVPKSATWMEAALGSLQVDYPRLRVVEATKDGELSSGWSSQGWQVGEVSVSSYTRGRVSGDEGSEIIWVKGVDTLAGWRVIVIDDVIAEGKTGVDLVTSIGKWEPARIDYVATVTKLMQGGSAALRNCGRVSKLVEAVRIAEVSDGGKIILASHDY